MFSTAVKIDKLNDYLDLSEECVLPVRKDGDSYEVKVKKGRNKLEPATAQKGSNRILVGLSDCMSCSGCLTSSEEIILKDRGYLDIATRIGESHCAAVSIAPQTAFLFAATYGISHQRAFRKLACFFKRLGAKRVYDLSVGEAVTLSESKNEFYETVKLSLCENTREKLERGEPLTLEEFRGTQRSVTLLAGHCPGWTVYAEKTQKEETLSKISRVASSQQVQGALIKTLGYLENAVQRSGLRPGPTDPPFSGRYKRPTERFRYLNNLVDNDSKSPARIYHVATAPCYDKKIEAANAQLKMDLSNIYRMVGETGHAADIVPVDDVLSTGDIQQLMAQQNVDFRDLPEYELDHVLTDRIAFLFSRLFKQDVGAVSASASSYSRPGDRYSASGGFAEEIMKFAAERLLHMKLEPEFEQTINSDYKEAVIKLENHTVMRFIMAHGFRNIQNILTKLKASHQGEAITYIEVMACPGGCFNGAGQIMEPPEQQSVPIIRRLLDLLARPDLMTPTEKALQLYHQEGKYECPDAATMAISVVIPTLHRFLGARFTAISVERKEAAKGAADLKW